MVQLPHVPIPVDIDMSVGTPPDFRSHFGAAWNQYEGTYIRMVNTGGVVTVSKTAPAAGSFTVTARSSVGGKSDVVKGIIHAT